MIEEKFHLLPPENLPSSREELQCNRAILQIFNNIPFSLQNSDQIELDLVRKVMNRLKFDFSAAFIVQNDPNESFENHANDQAFNIVRIKGDVLLILTHSVLTSYANVLEEVIMVGTVLSPLDWGKIRFAYIALFSMLTGRFIESNLHLSSLIPIQPTNHQLEKNNVLRRWFRGHHTFMSIIQGIIIAFNCCHNDIKKDKILAARTAINLATILMSGSEAILKFTSDFPQGAYAEQVRPTLSPPMAPPGMSGLHWRDHEYMIKKVFTKIQPLLSNPMPSIKQEVNDFFKSLEKVYEAHKYVCTFFIGHENPSLLSKKSASQMLENYKNNRIRMLKKEAQYDSAS